MVSVSDYWLLFVPNPPRHPPQWDPFPTLLLGVRGWSLGLCCLGQPHSNYMSIIKGRRWLSASLHISFLFFCYSFLLSWSGTWVLSMCISALGRGGEGARRTSYKSSSALLRFILVRQWLFLLKCFVKALPNDLLAGERLNSCMIFFVWWRKNSAIIQNSKWVLASC